MLLCTAAFHQKMASDLCQVLVMNLYYQRAVLYNILQMLQELSSHYEFKNYPLMCPSERVDNGLELGF